MALAVRLGRRAGLACQRHTAAQMALGALPLRTIALWDPYDVAKLQRVQEKAAIIATAGNHLGLPPVAWVL